MVYGNNDGVQISCNSFSTYDVAAIANTDYPFGNGQIGAFNNQGLCGNFFDDRTADNTFVNPLPLPPVFQNGNTPTDIFSDIVDQYNYIFRAAPNMMPSVNNGANVGVLQCQVPPSNCDGPGLLSNEEILNLDDEGSKNQVAKMKVKYYLSIGDKSSAVQLLEDLYTPLADKLLVAHYINNQNFATAHKILNTLPTHSLNNQQFKELYTIYLNSKEEGRSLYQLNYAEKQAIGGIAETYTQTGFEAQSLLSFLYGEYFPTLLPDLPVQSGNHRGGRKKSIDESHLILYPNPSFDKVYVDYLLVNKQKAMLLLYESNGRLVLEKSFLNSDVLEFEVGNLPKGLYHYQFFVDNQLVKTDKLVIIR